MAMFCERAQSAHALTGHVGVHPSIPRQSTTIHPTPHIPSQADVEVVVADFTPIPYEEQMRMSRASHVLIGMHGAGMVHGLDQAATDECGGPTALVELFPLPNSEKGVRNMNVQVGRTYYTWHNEDGSKETSGGTVVDLTAVAAIVRGAIVTILEGRKKCRGGD